MARHIAAELWESSHPGGDRVTELVKTPVPTENSESIEKSGDLTRQAVVSRGMLGTHPDWGFSWLARRFHSRAELKVVLIALRHQVALNRQRSCGPQKLLEAATAPTRYSW